MSWSHFKDIIYINDPLKREFYAEMSRFVNWSVRTLRDRIDSMLYECTALSRKPEELVVTEMRINSLYIKEFRNLKYFRTDFVPERTQAMTVNGKKNFDTEQPSWTGGSTL